MQKIFIPTDFSPVADNALDYAIEIATKFKSELYLYHAFTLHKVDYDLNFPRDEQPRKRRLEKQMKIAKLKFSDKLAQRGLSMHTIVEEDSVTAIFDRKAKKHGIDLIVMGSQGASGFKKAIFGSVAANAVQSANVPVLVVPPEHSFALQHIVLATDLDHVAAKVLSPLKKLATQFGARVTILNVNTGASGNKPEQIDAALENIDTTYREIPLSNSVNESINEFVTHNECDVLCMIRREKGFFESLLQKSFTQDQVYNSPIPLLVLPAR